MAKKLRSHCLDSFLQVTFHEQRQHNSYQLFLFLDLSPYQYSIGVIAILTRVRFVHSQADTVADDGEQYQELKGFPLHQGNTVFSKWILQR